MYRKTHHANSNKNTIGNTMCTLERGDFKTRKIMTYKIIIKHKKFSHIQNFVIEELPPNKNSILCIPAT